MSLCVDIRCYVSQCVVMCRYVLPCIFICVATCPDVLLYVLILMCMSICISIGVVMCRYSLLKNQKYCVAEVFRLDGDLSGVLCGSKNENIRKHRSKLKTYMHVYVLS